MFHKPSLHLPMLLAGLALHNHGISFGEVRPIPDESGEPQPRELSLEDRQRINRARDKRARKTVKRYQDQRRTAAGKGGAA